MSEKNNLNDEDEISSLERMLLEAEATEEPKAKSTVFNAGDSSDEEEARDCLSSKYNDFGKEINKALKQKEEIRKYNSIRVPQENSFKPDFSSLRNHSSPSTSQISTQTSTSTNKTEVIKRLSTPNDPSTFCDPVFGLRLINPLISSESFKNLMNGKTAVGVQRARFHTEKGDVSKDWVIAGVLVTKSPPKQTQKGDLFSIWSISDLRGEIKYVSLFLFKSAHKDLWKTNVGTAIGVLNPRILDRKDDKIEAAISVDNPQKVMILGQSKDLGRCRAKKANGETCDAVINKTDFDVCIFHMKKEYNNIRRSEFQSAGIGLGLQQLRNKVLGKSEVFYAGQSFTASNAAKKSAKMIKKDHERLSSLSEYFTAPYNPNRSPATTSIQRQSSSPTLTRPKPAGSAATHDSNINQRRKDWERLKLLQGTDKPEIILTAKKEEPIPTPSTYNTIPSKPNLSFTPKLSTGGLTFSVSTSSLKKNELLKQKAAEILKKKPLEVSNPNLIKYRGTQAGKRKIEDEVASGNENKKVKVETEDEKKRKEFIQRMMNATSSHANLAENREIEVREKALDSLEKKEAMEEKMANTMEVKVKKIKSFNLILILIFIFDSSAKL